MQLLVAVINHEEKLEAILAGFVELGITGATVVSTEGMGHVLVQEAPIFAGVTALRGRSRPTNRTVFSVVETEQVEPAIAMIQEVLGSLSLPGAGIVFALPVSRVEGMAKELE